MLCLYVSFSDIFNITHLITGISISGIELTNNNLLQGVIDVDSAFFIKPAILS